jgi:glycosyltransferase involved in cell wall biosynthesis
MNSLVSVIIPCYNQAQYLPDALNSVLAQTYSNWECIIVNDGSPDNTEEVALEWVEKDERLKYYKKENGGVSDARNFGIRKSGGEYILPLDADDKIGPEYLENALQAFAKNSDIGVVYCEAEYFGDQKGKWNLPEFSVNELLCRNIVFCSAFFRREDYNKTKGYDNDMKFGWEDWDFWLSLAELNCTFYRLPKTHFFYRIKENSRNQSLDETKSKVLYKQLFLCHIDFYFNNLGAPQEAYQKINIIVNSKDYRLAKFIVNPLRKLKKMIK